MRRCLIIFLFVIFSPSTFAERIKDLVDVAGVRSNQLIGYGLVAGLQGTGDGQDLRITGQSLQSLLSGLGVSVDGPVSEFDLGDSLVSLATQNVQQPIHQNVADGLGLLDFTTTLQDDNLRFVILDIGSEVPINVNQIWSSRQ